MKFELIGDPACRDLRITATTPAEAAELAHHYKMDVLTVASAIMSGQLEYVDAANKRDNYGWHAMSVHMPKAWLQPYLDLLAKQTGYSGPLPDGLELPKYPAYHVVNLQYTHLVLQQVTQADGVAVTGLIKSGDWNGKTGPQRALPHFEEYLCNDWGDRKREPEFLEQSGGWLRRNPKYPSNYYPHPAATSPRGYEALLYWWLDTHASAKQREVFEQSFALHRGVCRTDQLGSWMLRNYEGYRLDWGDPAITFAAFKELA